VICCPEILHPHYQGQLGEKESLTPSASIVDVPDNHSHSGKFFKNRKEKFLKNRK
jgi:hypothetical protein